MLEKKVPIFLNLKGTFFVTMKNEQARALPLFSHDPYSKQEDIQATCYIFLASMGMG
jgi:hypothetical protein